MQGTTFVGLDVHKRWINVAVLFPGHDTALEWRIANEAQAIRKMLRRVAEQAGGDVRYCYEAGPCGYALQRQIISWSDASCMLIAPSLTPRKPGERIKTDRRDARKLAQLFRAGLLTEVHPLTEQDEAARDLSRAREDLREDLVRARHRLSKFLLRRGLCFTQAQRAWSLAHRRWIESLRFDSPADSAVIADYLLAIDQIEERIKDLIVHLERLAIDPRYARAVATLRCFRSFDTITAVGLAVELHNFERFTSARRLMSFVGLIPGEHSSGEKRRQGAITKTGNSHVRRLLIEAAWNYRHRPHVGVPLRNRRKGQPPRTVALADRAMQRLHRRYQQMTLRGVMTQKAIVAMARELAGFVWAALSPLAQPPTAH
ncbi:MAG TPA: IS110 family transposase [Actinomycetota bacterium]